MIDEEVPQEIGDDHISIAPSLYTHSSVIANIQNKMIESSKQIQNDPTILKSSATNDLFKEDNMDISSFDPDNPKYKSKPHEVHFQALLFLKFLLFSFIFSVTGPFAILIFYWKHKQLIYNFQWLGFSWPVLFTYLRFIIDVLIIVGFVVEPFDMTSYSLSIYYVVAFVSELVFQNLMLAFYHPQKIDLLQRFPLKQIINRFENQINPFLWASQPRTLIEFELEQSMKRNHIEPALFVFYFIVLPNEKRRDKISHQFENAKKDKYAGNGLKMAVEIIEYFNNQSSIFLYIAVAILLTLIRFACTIFYSQFWEEGLCKIFMYIAITAIHTVGYGCIVSTMMITFRDLQRKVFSLNQLSHLISAQQVEEYDETKIFPTLNFLCVQSLFSWQNLRKVLLDYGLQYYQRENALISYFLEVVLALIVMAILTNFQVINFFQDTGLACVKSLLFLIGYDVLTVIFLAILIVLQGARINKHYELHQTMLKKNMFTYQQLSTQSFIKKEYHVQPQDFMFKTLKNTIDRIEVIGSKNWFFLYSQYVINAIDQAYNDLRYEEERKPFTVLGIAMTNKLAFQLIASFLGIFGTVISSLYLNFNF